MTKKTIVTIFYSLFIICGSMSLVFIPNALSYKGGSELSLLITFLPLAYLLWLRFGFRFFLKLTFSLSLFALFIEYIGLTTGWPYGSFQYSGELGSRIFGVLPWTVGLSWTPLVIGSVAMAYSLTRKRWIRIILPVFLLLTYDMLLDPAAIKVGMWSYTNEGLYYGVPVQNFFGWILSGLIGSMICFVFLNSYTIKNMHYFAISFLISILFWTVIALALGLVGPAIFGLSLTTLIVVIHHKKNEEIS